MSAFDPETLARDLAGMDIYVLDQIQRGRIPAGARILDAGCGGGRNLQWFLRGPYEVYGIDADPDRVTHTQARVAHTAGPEAAARIRTGRLEALPYSDASFDVVLLNAVLHFADSTATFEGWVDQAMRVLRPGGLFFARLTTTIAMGDRPIAIGSGRYHLPDGSERYLATREQLGELTDRYGHLADPIKTTRVEALRAMTTWVVLRGDDAA